MSFFDSFNSAFIQFKRDNKKTLKGDSSPKVLDKFLKEKGGQLRKELERAVLADEKINFGNLPPQAKNELGGADAPGKIRREDFAKNGKVLSLSNTNYIFNDGNIIDDPRGVIARLMAGKGYKDKIIIGENIFKGGDKNKEGREFFINGSGYKVTTRDDIKRRFNKLSKQNGGLYPVWELYGLFNQKNDYILIINIVGYADSP